MAELKGNTQRLFDLVRYQRGELFAADLVSPEEYAELALDHGSVDRLESYDAMRQDIDRLRSLLREVLQVIRCFWAIPCQESQPDNPCESCQLAAKIREELK